MPPFFLKELLNSFILRSLSERYALFRYNVVLVDFVTVNESVRHVDGVVLLSVFGFGEIYNSRETRRESRHRDGFSGSDVASGRWKKFLEPGRGF